MQNLIRIILSSLLISVNSLIFGQTNHKKSQDTIISFTLRNYKIQIKQPKGWEILIYETSASIIPSLDSVPSKGIPYKIDIIKYPTDQHFSTKKATKIVLGQISNLDESKDNFKVLQNRCVRINKKKFQYIEYQWSQSGELLSDYRFLKSIGKNLILLYGGNLIKENEINKSVINFWNILRIKRLNKFWFLK